jgi:DNA replication protein DnaC
MERYGSLLKMLARVELLILDDWGLAPLTLDQGRDLLEVLDDRHGRSSTIVTSQLPVDHWHELIGNPTVGPLKGESWCLFSYHPAPRTESCTVF